MVAERSEEKVRRNRPPKGWRDTFISEFRKHGNVTAAAKKAGVDRNAAYALRKRDPKFAEAWAEAEEEACDILEAAARNRAISGSDVLMIFLLKAHRPEKYREPKAGGPNVNIRTEDGAGGSVEVGISYEEAVRALRDGEEGGDGEDDERGADLIV